MLDERGVLDCLHHLETPSLCPRSWHMHVNQFPADSFPQVCRAIASSQLKHLQVTFSDCDRELAQYVRAAVRESRSIVCLQLEEDSISAGACLAVAEGLSQCRGVRQLDMKIHQLNHESAKSLAEILTKNRTLLMVLLNCIEVDLRRGCLDVLSAGLARNPVITDFSLIDATRGCALSTWAITEAVERNQKRWYRATLFVLAADCDRRRVEAFDSLCGVPCFVCHVAAISGVPRDEVQGLVNSARLFICANYLIITKVVARKVECLPGQGMQLDGLNADCWLAIAKYLKVSDVLDN